MKVFVYIGSPRGEESTGYQFIKKVEEHSKTLRNDIIFDIFSADKLNIKESDGTGKEFITGNTIYDDDMKIIEKSLLSSDFIIFLSPVYAHNISGQAKIFIDRLSYWLHIFRLIGKKGYVVSVSCNNGNDLVNSYLTEVMQFLGIYVLGEMSIETTKINSDDVLNSYARFLAKKIVISQEESDIEIPYTQEKMFEHQKLTHLKSEIYSKEKQFWKENNYFDYNTFEDLFKSRMKV
ncbi:flavodoxin family protein [Clostridium sp. Sa3CUN1]|uniref:Flavodoxin family protein n=1 Tax=Clostridium gallinarum TaxID=2762246 RepID=A0ABR8Q7M6_9CLOT|nr:flavodoxin family protein [Clostridium gallinarum]MBD7916420.1 flavodoxin family protein [Clostridium gallinarum]